MLFKYSGKYVNIYFNMKITFPFVTAEFETDKRLLRLMGQLLATAFSFVAAVVGPHLGGLSEGQAEQGLQSH